MNKTFSYEGNKQEKINVKDIRVTGQQTMAHQPLMLMQRSSFRKYLLLISRIKERCFTFVLKRNMFFN